MVKTAVSLSLLLFFCSRKFAKVRRRTPILPVYVKSFEVTSSVPVATALSEIISEHCQAHRLKFDAAETSFVLVANRLCEPASEHGLARWLEHTFVCDSQGRRWQPDWIPAEYVSKQQ